MLICKFWTFKIMKSCYVLIFGMKVSNVYAEHIILICVGDENFP